MKERWTFNIHIQQQSLEDVGSSVSTESKTNHQQNMWFQSKVGI